MIVKFSQIIENCGQVLIVYNKKWYFGSSLSTCWWFAVVQFYVFWWKQACLHIFWFRAFPSLRSENFPNQKVFSNSLLFCFCGDTKLFPITTKIRFYSPVELVVQIYRNFYRCVFNFETRSAAVANHLSAFYQ